MLFVKFSAAQIAALQAAELAGYLYDSGYMRLVCSWATTDEEVSRFIATVS
jgi:threonine aldolase